MLNTEVILNLPPGTNTEGAYHVEAVEDTKSVFTISSENSYEEDKDISNFDNDYSQQPTINVVNSSDVIIGSVTQFHGPVTIVQQVPSKQSIEDKNEKANLVTTNSTTLSSEKPLQACLPKRLLVCFATITVLIALIVLSVIFSLDTPYDDISTYSEESGTTRYNITGHSYYTIKTWGGRDPLWETNITQPIIFVIISHTAGKQCLTFNDCATDMRNIQSDHVSNGSPNVGYNFVIGGDGDIYEGRGWFARNFHRDSTIGICFMGNYVFDELTDDMIDALQKLLSVGVILDVLPSTYQIVAHNQTMATLSPGNNVYEVIKDFPNFYPYPLPIVRD